MGVIFTILGIYTVYQLWSANVALAIIAVIATLYQTSSLNELFKERRGQPEDKWQTRINILSSMVIIILFLLSFFL